MGVPEGITCSKFELLAGTTRRCRHYLPSGACALPDEGMCVEWLKVNRPAPAPGFLQAPPARPVRKLPVASTSSASPSPDAALPVLDPERIPGLDRQAMDAFRARGVEVKLESEVGEVWVVPEYTGQPRHELTPDNLATVVQALTVFPGSRVVRFEPARAKGEPPTATPLEPIAPTPPTPAPSGPAQPAESAPRNAHLSFSRLSRYEQCPLSYRLHYVDKKLAEPGIPLRFGKLIHAVLERLLAERIADQPMPCSLSEERALELYREAWTAEGLTGAELFSEGQDILRRFVRQQGEVDARDVLAVEKEFRLPVGRFTVLGFIDRVDRLDSETIEIIDYKTNHQLFTRDEIDSSLQMSLYHAAAKQLWPWAKRIKLTFWMLRHEVKQETSRTDQEIADALAYVETLGVQTERATEFPARLNANCSYCDHRADCSAYAEALKGTRSFVCEDTTDLEAVAREREEVANLAKVLYARKEELEGVLKAHLKHQEKLLLGGVEYRTYATTTLEFPVQATLDRLVSASGLSREDVVARVTEIDKKRLEDLVKSLPLDKSAKLLLQAELESKAKVRHSARFWAKRKHA